MVFLDCIIDAGTYPLPEIDAAVKANRKVGLGVMGFADLCYKMEIAYDSPEASQWASSIMSHIDTAANRASQDLGRLRGSFPNIDKSVYVNTSRRNAELTTIAPTGTIAMIADASYGIEPFFALSYTKKLVDTEEEITFLNDHIQCYLNKHNFSEALSALVKSYIIENGTIKGVYEAGLSLSGKSQEALLQMEEIFVTAQEIAPVGHVQIQAAFQKHTDNAVSKTINFAEDVSVADIKYIFELAYKRKCKGITVYRDGCRDSQPLKIKKTAEETPKKHEHPEGLKRPTQLTGVTRQIPTGCGMMLVTVNMDEDGEVFETLMRAGASGGCSAYTDAVARLISIALRYGVPLDVLIDQLRSVRCDNFRYQSGKNPALKGKSCPDVVGRFLQDIVDENGFKKLATADKAISAEQLDNILQQAMINTTGAEGEKCPECGKLLLQAEGCLSCQCGYSRC
ncbi:MAG: TSCPD domain-containing protein [Herbinix sp.]|nr:TSCPD domain-containing protein [Herbinix sp.]